MKKLKILFGLVVATLAFTAISCPSPTNPTEEEASLTGISVNSDGAKTVFAVGEDFSYEGLIVKAVYSDSSKKTLSEGFTVNLASANLDSNGKIARSSADSSAESATSSHRETAKVTVSYESFTASYDVTISDVITKLEVTVDTETVKTSYSVGDSLDKTGVTVKAFYGDDDTTGEDVSSLVTISAVFTNDASADTTPFTTENAGSFTLKYTASLAGVSGESGEITIKVLGTDDSGYDAPDLTSYYKKYFVTTSSEVAKFGITVDTWSSGASATTNDDGTLTLTSASMWSGVEGVVAAFVGLNAGTLANYEYVVLTFDMSNFTVSSGDGNNGVNVKIPDVQLSIADNYVKNSDGTYTYYAKISDFNSASTATEFALIAGGSGTLVVKEIYVAATEDPSTKAVTSISISPTAASLSANGTQQFTVKDSNQNDVTSSATYTLSGDAATGSSITEAGLLTVGTTSGTLTVKATYTVDGSDFTAEATITVLGDITNLITSATVTTFAAYSGWNDANVAATGSFSEGWTWELANATDGQWKAQFKISTDADIAKDDNYYFSVNLKSTVDMSNITVKFDDEKQIVYDTSTSLTANTEKTITFSGTSEVDAENITIVLDFGNNPATTLEISDITLAKTN